MHAKLINPKTNGEKAYNNQGSAAQVLNYLTHEAKQKGEHARFFDGEQDLLDREAVLASLDGNVKGLRAGEAKFYSLVLSPSPEELAHIGGGDEAKLRAYTRDVMTAYAAGFRLKGGGAVGKDDLVWGAIIHHERTHRGTDAAVRAGEARPGQARPGLQAHIHVVVSARDRAQRVTLNPGGRVSRFSLRDWQEEARVLFERQFQYQGPAPSRRPAPAIPEPNPQRNARIAERVEQLNRQADPSQRLDVARVQRIAQGRGYDRIFYDRLRRLEGRARQGQPLDNAYHLLATGREEPARDQTGHQVRQALHSFQQALRATSGPDRVATQDIGEQRGRRQWEPEL
ncbi:hypothetical protein J0X19_20965 [Hymenobacter sp. BT186]|uniref:Mobilization protein n=1 Tax=Hymenobacter telluris TaxID=2816474 RepID=A0A939JCQ8_9BACT|nr:DUF5712 family protein [Hymenobacter telluris]MBO0360446.1 hypothetical protein [Hymenobacter telluris]MBW3376473.1 hypothetical protein [Hymenobacter norwichensis]